MAQSARSKEWKPQLLVVDDDPDMVEWLADLFGRKGAEVKTALDGTEALRKISEEEDRFILVVTDVRMPAPSGIQLVAMTRYAGYNVPFVVITAFPDQQVDEMVHKLDRTELLAKPFTPDDLLAACQRLAGFPQNDVEPSSQAAVDQE